jgi:16S rRNA (cytosine1402-N4)-methyltransferase
MVDKKHISNQNAPQPADPSNPAYHVPVLLEEAVQGLNVRKDGLYVDCTYGGGGHSRELIRHLGDAGRLYVFDQDTDVMKNVPDDKRLTFLPHNFRHLKRFLRLHKVLRVDGILADLGVSSHQFDESDRGFSIRFDGELDMRMDKRQSLTAYQIVSTYSELQLHKLFEQYGEVTNARTLAKTIVQMRQCSPLRSIANFRHAINSAVKGNPNRWFAQVFQALRIEVNDELGALKEMLLQVPDLLNPGGRVAIITFHSLEDRIVKNFFKKGSFSEELVSPFGQDSGSRQLKAITKKPIIPTDFEMKQNPRSRSAKLRIAEKG